MSVPEIFLRVYAAAINPTIGDIDANAVLIADAAARGRAAGADVVLLPELCICGYPPKDLLLQEGFAEACVQAALRVGRKHSQGVTLIFGGPLPRKRPADNVLLAHAGTDATFARGAMRHGGVFAAPALANSLLAFRDGGLVATYDKRLLPTYDVFDEDRYFEPGTRAVVIDVPTQRAGGATARVGLSICEDLWKGEDAGFASRYDDAPDPVAQLAAAGAKVILSPSASPFVLGKGERHRDIIRLHATRHGVHVISLNQLGGNDELVFDGHVYACDPSGAIRVGAELFGAAFMRGERRAGKQTEGVIDLGAAGVTTATSAAPTAPGSPVGASAGDTATALAAADEELLYRALVLGVRDYCAKTGFKSALLGLSGGVDSALTAVIAAAALGARNITGIALPSKYSTSHSIEDAQQLASALKMPFHVMRIDEPFEGARRAIDPLFAAAGLAMLGKALPDLSEENLQSRVRGTMLMAMSNRSGAILLTTGNKSELAVGYCTLYGDMNGGLAVLSDVSKNWVYRLSRYINANAAALGFGEPPIPERTILKAPSAELRPDQTDQDSLPAYDVLDEIISRAVERRQSAARIIRETGFDGALVARCLRMIDLAEYKRKQTAVGLKVTSVAFGSGRRVPIVQRWRGS
jgi:NAD+ synthase (glutamine-hydrolysing)